MPIPACRRDAVRAWPSELTGSREGPPVRAHAACGAGQRQLTQMENVSMNQKIHESLRARHPPEMRCISRLTERGCSPGWRVSISRRKPRRDFQKYFLDHAHGGTEGALAAAQAWRDEIEAKNPRTTKRQLASLVRKHNTTGASGVYRRIVRRKSKDGRIRTYAVWQAQTPLSVVPYRTRSFSVIKFGEQEAKRLAIEARWVFEAALGGVERSASVLGSTDPGGS